MSGVKKIKRAYPAVSLVSAGLRLDCWWHTGASIVMHGIALVVQRSILV